MSKEYSIYDPQVVDDRVEYLNSVFNADDWQQFIWPELNRRVKTPYRGKDPKVKFLEEYRKKVEKNG